MAALDRTQREQALKNRDAKNTADSQLRRADTRRKLVTDTTEKVKGAVQSAKSAVSSAGAKAISQPQRMGEGNPTAPATRTRQFLTAAEKKAESTRYRTRDSGTTSQKSLPLGLRYGIGTVQSVFSGGDSQGTAPAGETVTEDGDASKFPGLDDSRNYITGRDGAVRYQDDLKKDTSVRKGVSFEEQMERFAALENKYGPKKRSGPKAKLIRDRSRGDDMSNRINSLVKSIQGASTSREGRLKAKADIAILKQLTGMQSDASSDAAGITRAQIGADARGQGTDPAIALNLQAQKAHDALQLEQFKQQSPYNQGVLALRDTQRLMASPQGQRFMTLDAIINDPSKGKLSEEDKTYHAAFLAKMNPQTLNMGGLVEGFEDGGMIEGFNAGGAIPMGATPAIEGPPQADPMQQVMREYGQYTATATKAGLEPIPLEQYISMMQEGQQMLQSAPGTAAEGYAEGGAIPVGGQQVIDPAVGPVPEGGDTIPAVIDGHRPAALKSGEFVIPEEVVRAKGTEFFEKLIAQYRPQPE